MPAEASKPFPSIDIPWWKPLAVLGLAGLTLLACHLSPTPEVGNAAGVVMELPDKVGSYVGFPEEISQAEKTILPPDTEFARKTYHSAQHDRILCSIVLSGAEKRSIHRPEICLDGQGWTLKSGEVLDVPLHNGSKLPVMNLTIERAAQLDGKPVTVRSYYMYWFVGKDKTTPKHLTRVFLTSWDRLFHNIYHRWAYVIVSSTITEGLGYPNRSAEETLKMLEAFIADIAPSFQKVGLGPNGGRAIPEAPPSS
jgi:EpsI family protein